MRILCDGVFVSRSELVTRLPCLCLTGMHAVSCLNTQCFVSLFLKYIIFFAGFLYPRGQWKGVSNS